MNANELRIGSYVMHRDNMVVVTEIKQEHIKYKKVFNDGDWDYLSNIHPIPLTEEMLLKCGFEHNYNAYYGPKNNKEFNLKIAEHDGVYQIAITAYFILEVKFIHQLQNLYFVLTGKELEVNL